MRFPSECSSVAGGHFSKFASQRASQPGSEPASQLLVSQPAWPEASQPVRKSATGLPADQPAASQPASEPSSYPASSQPKYEHQVTIQLRFPPGVSLLLGDHFYPLASQQASQQPASQRAEHRYPAARQPAIHISCNTLLSNYIRKSAFAWKV